MEDFLNGQFETLSITDELACQHENVDGATCLDCFAILTTITGVLYSETTNYMPRKVVGSTIKIEDVQSLSLPNNVYTWAKELFEIISKHKIFRGPSRIGVIAACVLHGYRHFEVEILLNDVLKLLQIPLKKCLAGFQKVDLILWHQDRERYKSLRAHNMTFKNAAQSLAKKLQIVNIEHIDFDSLINKEDKQYRITTMATIAVWKFIQKNKIDITITQVATAADLSPTTIKKLTKKQLK